MFKFSFGLKALSGALMVVGLFAYITGVVESNRAADDIKKNGYQSKPMIERHLEQKKSAKYLTDMGDIAPIVLEPHNAKTKEKHVEHAYHQMKNRPWTAVYIAAIMFLLISLASLFFLAVQHASSAGWSIILVRVMEAMASYLPLGGAILFGIMILSGMHFNHIFHWMDESLLHKFMIPASGGETAQYVDKMIKGAVENPNYDHVLAGKHSYLSVPYWLTRAFLYIAGWCVFLYFLRKTSRQLDENPNNKKLFIRQRNISAGFIVFFAVTSSLLSWDWIMSFDPHWYSTLYGWYTFSSYLVCAIAIILLVSVFLKKQGMFPQFNDNHLHDLTKFMFGFSLLWAYLWFAQFLLYWYANIPEEVAYYYERFDQHRLLFLGMLIPNFAMPLVILVSSTIKRKYSVVCFMAIVVLIGHYVDFFVMMEPGSVGSFAKIGFAEIGALLFFIGLFLFVIFRTMSKNPPQPTGNPLYHESETYHYPH